MTRHARTICGLLVLLAMTFSLAETVWASMCAPPGAAVIAASAQAAAATSDTVEAASDEAAATEAASADAAPAGKESPMPGHCPPAGEAGDDEPSECPFGFFGGPQGCVAASLPGLSPVTPQASAGRIATVIAEPHRFASATSIVPFHPPRA